jgi:hypothetical protein
MEVKEVVVAYFKVFSRRGSGDTEEKNIELQSL